ncbi:MAG TPA: hypothetical protein VFR02_08140 [bacterium]|nr:hypothetical protein [bacterium]
MTSRRRPAYIEERITYHLARQRARREHPQPCTCHYCIDSATREAMIRRNIERGQATYEEIPF